MQDRLTELEIKVTYQEDLLDQLNRVLVEQQEQLDRLARRVAELELRPRGGLGYDGDPSDEPPPHY